MQLAIRMEKTIESCRLRSRRLSSTPSSRIPADVLFAGALCAAVAAVMTAIKSGDVNLWPCAAMLIIAGAFRSLDMRYYRSLCDNGRLTQEAVERWEVRYQIGAMIYALCARRVVRSRPCRQQRTVVH